MCMIRFLCKKTCVRVGVCVQMCVCMYILYYVPPINSPHNDDDKVQHVPAVSDVGVLVHHQAIGNNLQKCLYCENDEEGIFYCLLHRGKAGRGGAEGKGKNTRCLFKLYNPVGQWCVQHFPLDTTAAGSWYINLWYDFYSLPWMTCSRIRCPLSIKGKWLTLANLSFKHVSNATPTPHHPPILSQTHLNRKALSTNACCMHWARGHDDTEKVLLKWSRDLFSSMKTTSG